MAKWVVVATTATFLGLAATGHAGSPRNRSGRSIALAEAKNTVANTPTQQGYFSLPPARLLDTRPGGTTIDTTSAGSGVVGANAALDLVVAGRGGVPSTGVDSVILNLTATGATQTTFVTVWPTGDARPNASNINPSPGRTDSNLVIAKLGVNGRVSIYNESGNVHIIADVEGWFKTGGGFTSLTPIRVLDTRSGATTIDHLSESGGALGAGGVVNLQVTGRGGVPASGVSAVVINLTGTGATATTFLTSWPAGQNRPNASNLNPSAGITNANLVIAKVGANGMISIFNESGSVHLIADVAGWFPTGSSYGDLAPQRLLDTRVGASTVDHDFEGQGTVGGGVPISLHVTGRGGVPSVGVGAVVLNITAPGPSATSFVTVWPSGSAMPNASNLNPIPGSTDSNLVIVKVNADGNILLAHESGTLHLIADVVGWFPVATDAVSSGALHTCALLSDHSVSCWGQFTYGQLGYPGNVDSPIASASAVAGGATAIATGNRHTCALLDDTTVRCWGNNDHGELGDPGVGSGISPVTPVGLGGVTEIVAGNSHTCALLGNGTVKCWGSNVDGQLGDSSIANHTVPAIVPGLTGVVAIAATGWHTCALLSSGAVTCWGLNTSGQVTPGGAPSVRTPALVSGVTNAVSIANGGNHSCAVISGGSVKCWGNNLDGQLGDGSFITPNSVQTVSGLTTATNITAGTSHTCAIVMSGGIQCWGLNSSGQLGNGTTSSSSIPVASMTASTTAVQVSAGGSHTCVISSAARPSCWGSNANGELGTGTTTAAATPTFVVGLA